MSRTSLEIMASSKISFSNQNYIRFIKRVLFPDTRTLSTKKNCILQRKNGFFNLSMTKFAF